MAAGDILLDADGNRLLDADGNFMLSNGVDDSCCCGGGSETADCEICDTPVAFFKDVTFADNVLCPCKTTTVGISWSISGDLNGTYRLSYVGSKYGQPCVWEAIVEDTVTANYYPDSGSCDGTPEAKPYLYIVFILEADGPNVVMNLYAVVSSHPTSYTSDTTNIDVFKSEYFLGCDSAGGAPENCSITGCVFGNRETELGELCDNTQFGGYGGTAVVTDV